MRKIILDWIQAFFVTADEPHLIASIIRDYPRFPKPTQPLYLPPETQALLKDIGNGEEKNNLFVQLKNILISISPDIINIIVAYYSRFLWLEWAENFQLTLSQFERYPVYRQLMIKNFFILLISSEKKPGQPIVLQDRILDSIPTKYHFKLFKDPHTAAEFLTSEGVFYRFTTGKRSYCLTDMLKEVGLEKKSNALLQETLFWIGGYEKFTLKQSDLYLFSQIHKNSYCDFTACWEEIKTHTELFQFLNNPYQASNQILLFAEEEGEYSVIASSDKPLSKILSNLPVLEQEFIEFQKNRAEPLGTKTLDLINGLEIFPTCLSEKICSYLYLQPTQTGFNLAHKTFILLGNIWLGINRQERRDIGLRSHHYSYLHHALLAIAEQSSLVAYIENQKVQQMCYPNPMKIIALRGNHFLECLGKLNKKSPDQQERVWVVELQVKIIQMVNFCQAYTCESPQQSAKQSIPFPQTASSPALFPLQTLAIKFENTKQTTFSAV